MEITAISDAIVTVASHTAILSKLNFTASNINLSLSDQSFAADQPPPQISCVILPLDSVAPPPVKPKSHVKTIPKRFTHKRRRAKPKSRTGGGDNDFWVSGDGGDFMNFNNNYSGDGYFGGYGGGGGWGGGAGGGDNNMGWNFNWDESGSNSYSDPAFDFVYEVLSWIVLSNCLHFAYKKVVRIVAEGFGDTAREKAPIRLTAVC